MVMRPAQIVGWLKQIYPMDENFQASYETTYRNSNPLGLKKVLL